MVAPTAVSVSTPVAGTGNDSVDLTYPSDILFGDILVSLVWVESTFGETINDYFVGFSGLGSVSTATGVRRGAACSLKVATGSETGTYAFNVSTTGGIGQVGGCMMLIRNAHTVDSFHSEGSAGITSSTAPAPASVTTTENDELVIAAYAYSNTGTITINTTNPWDQVADVQNDGTNSFHFQYIAAGSAQTISGGSSTLGTSGNWGVLTFALKTLSNFFIPASVVVS